jgi:3-phenylpropionate/trans-cinnamate dioxygenase ferredoxin component
MKREPQFVVVAALDHLNGGAFMRVTIEGHGLVVARNGDRVCAFQGTCPHEKADLAQGRIEGGRLICPRHLASFALDDGQVSRGWKVEALKLYPVRIEDGMIAVDAEAVRANPPVNRKIWDFTRR